MIREQRCSLCSIIALFSDLPRGSRAGPRVFVGSSLKSLEDPDRVHGDCLRVPGGAREFHKIVLEAYRGLVDLLTNSVASQEARKTTNHCSLVWLEASASPNLEFWRPRGHDPRDIRNL